MKKKLQIFLMLILIGFQSFANAGAYQQCGGIGWTGETQCVSGTMCVMANPYFYQCLPCFIGECPPDGNPTDPTNPTNAKYQKETFTGQKLVVTSVTGTAALKAGLKIGQVLGLDIAADVKAGITASLKNCYKTVCYTGGTCNCTSLDWTVCETSGCPIAGTSC